MNTRKIVLMGIAFMGLLSPFIVDASIPCGTTDSSTVLNVGILPGNLPWSAFTGAGVPEGFDVLLIKVVAELLGYSTVNFISYANAGAAEAALAAGTIDIYANSGVNFSAIPPSPYIGVITDVSGLNSGAVRGWLLAGTCCDLALALEVSINAVTDSGEYAYILQTLRLDGLTGGLLLGRPASATGVLLDPFVFASSEVGTIPLACATGPIAQLPATNCISNYLQASCSVTVVTGVTGI